MVFEKLTCWLADSIAPVNFNGISAPLRDILDDASAGYESGRDAVVVKKPWPTFLSLPNEILLRIIDESCPDGIESLALCCKRIHVLAEKTIERHIVNRKQFSRRRLEWPSGRTEQNSVNHFGIQELLTWPEGAPYVKELHIRGAEMTKNATLADPEYGRLPVSIDIQKWRSFFDVSTCAYIPNCDARDWAEKLEDLHVMAAAGMLLALLPNLEILTLQDIHDATMLAKMVRKIDGEKRRRGSIPYHGFPLGKLRTLNIYRGSSDICTTGLLQSIIMSPAIHSLLVDPGAIITLAAAPPIQGTSNLKAVNFESAKVRPEHIRRLLSHVRALEEFEYRYDNISDHYNPAAIIQMLEMYAGHSLVYLKLIQGSIWSDDIQDKVFCFVGSLRNFQNLRRVEIDLGMLAYFSADRVILAPLMDLLPTSLQDLHIVGGIKTFLPMNFDDLFAGIQGWKTKQKSSLTSIKLHHDISDLHMTKLEVSHEISIACQESGISITGLVAKPWPSIQW